jgi:predicted nucleic acid-binding protein
MNLFIDTNVLLNCYHFSGDDLAELDKLAVLLRNGKITLFLPDQVKDEFYRNRDNKIADALKEFRKEKLDRQFPQMTKQYDEYKKMRDAIKTFEENKQAILEKLKEDISNDNLKADKIIKELFSNAKNIPTSAELYQKAKIRFDIGRPPGKRKSYGDAINWEALLETVKDMEELFFITDDSDYFSEVDPNKFDPYLLNEWTTTKYSSLTLFKNLTGFFSDRFPEIKLVDEYEKNLLIEKLSKSSNFATTHSLLAQLNTFDSFSKAQVDDIILASVSNSQIYWISSDNDVDEILNKIADKHSSIIAPDLLERFNEIYNPDTDE